jgi:folate-binding protein YgfZ
MVTSHFGNPLSEQRSLLQGKSAVELDELSVIRVEGADRLSWLHSLLSQNLRSLSAGQSTEALLLDPQGHIEQSLKIYEDGQATWLLSSPSAAESLAAWLRKMIFRMQVKIETLSSAYRALGYFGEHEFQTKPTLIWQDSWPDPKPGSVRYSSAKPEPWNYKIALFENDSFEKAKSEFENAGSLALTALRIAAHRPEFDSEVDDRSLPHELDWLASAVHLSKGCYRGQESVAKVHNLGHPPRRLVLLHLDGSGHLLPEAGAELYQVDVPAPRGRITSVGQHFEMGPIALAVIARSTPVDATLLVKTEVGEISASQEIIVPPSAGKTAELPKRNLLMGGRK